MGAVGDFGGGALFLKGDFAKDQGPVDVVVRDADAEVDVVAAPASRSQQGVALSLSGNG